MNSVKFLGTGADDVALALKMYIGHFSDAWREAIHFAGPSGDGVIMRETVTEGKEFQFLQFADIPDAEDFEPGDEMIGQDFAVGEGSIRPDKYLVAHKFIRQDQIKFAHFSLIPRFAKAHAMKIGRKRDRRLAIMLGKAARTAAATKNGLTIHNGGNRVTRDEESVAAAYPLSSAGAANFVADARALAYQQDLDNIPSGPGQRRMWVPPYINQVLQFDNTGQIFSREYVDPATNSIQKRMVRLLAGFEIEQSHPNYMTNGGPIPDTNITNELPKYNLNFSLGVTTGTPVALVASQGPDGGAAVGEITFENVQHVVKYIPEKLGWLFLSYCLHGADVVDPYCAGSIEVIDTD